jgi:predicted ATPase/DNA-binding SARP family transcriptional activator
MLVPAGCALRHGDRRGGCFLAEGTVLEVRLLGDVQVRLHGAVVPVVSGRQRMLLARLALAGGRFVPVAQLIDDLWEDRPPDSAVNALQVYVSGLRKLLGSATVRTRGRAYALDDATVVDVMQFREEVTAGLGAASAGDAAGACRWLDRGLGHWNGLPCQGLEEAGFVSAAQAGLTDLYLSGMEARAAARIGQGTAIQVVPELRDLAEQHPFREGIHAQLILALAASGRQVEALAVYDRVRTELAEEFGVDPGEALQSAHGAVLRNELPVPRSVSAAGPVPRASHNLPAAVSSFVGRQQETAGITASLAAARLLTLTGPGGGGKTRLALNVAEGLLGQYRDGIWLAELAARTDQEGLAQAAAAALDISEAPPAALADTLIERLRERDLLLVLDNCEHLVRECAELAARILARCPRVRILATSRTRLGVPGEIEWTVPPLQVPDPQRVPPLGRLSEYASVRLFTDRASAVMAGFALTQANAAAVAAVCARLAGIPLAIELAAARARVLSVTQIAARLDEQLSLLGDMARHGPARQRTLRDTMDWSFDLLTGREQALFARLSVFVGGFSLEAAEEMAGDEAGGLDVFSRLVIHSLVAVERDGESARYRLLEPLRQYAAERLAGRDEAPGARARHAAYYLRLAEEAEASLRGGPEQATWFRKLGLEQDNLRAALRELARQADMIGIARAVSALWRFFLSQDSISEGRRLLDQALGHPSVAGLVRARALRTCGIFASEHRDYEHAARCYEQSLGLFRAGNATQDAAGILANLGLLAMNRSQFSQAQHFMQESLQLRRAQGDVLEIALSLDNLGHLALDQGDLPRAREFLQESLEWFRRGNDMLGESVALGSLSQVALQQGNRDEAVRLYGRALHLNRKLDDQWATNGCLEGLAEIAASRDEMAQAAAFLSAAATLRERTGEVLSPAEEAENRKLLVTVEAALGTAELEKARADGRTHALDDPIGYGLDYISRVTG